MAEGSLTPGRSVVQIGATGAVGGEVVRVLLTMPSIERLTLLGRRPLNGVSAPVVQQRTVDVPDAPTYQHLLAGHQVAICTLGVGEPSKVSKEEFVRIDHDAVVAFATACRAAGVQHFQLLSSVGADAGSASFYLKTKGRLQEALKKLNFERLSLFQPSMILTPTNRYGWSQGLMLSVWPWLNPVLVGGLRKFRGIPVATLGAAIARSVTRAGRGTEVLTWDEITQLGG